MAAEQDLKAIVLELRDASLFKDLGDSELEAVARLAVVVEPPPGTLIMQRSEHAEYLWVIVDGMMDLQATTIPGSRRVGTPGITYGIPGLVSPYRYTSTVRTVTPSRLLRVRADELVAFCVTNHSLGFRLMRAALQETQERIWEIIAYSEGRLVGDYIE